MIIIESMQVIPMNRESIFEDTPLNTFECSITTSYEEWKNYFEKEFLKISCYPTDSKFGPRPVFDEVCESFAKDQKAYMLGPVAVFHDIVYTTKTMKLPSKEYLDAVSNSGPLYMVFKEYVDDKDAGKTVERFYTNPDTFQPMHGMWYPVKEQYRVRFGIREKKEK